MKTDIDRELRNPDNYRFGVFYFNKKDKRVVVPKLDSYRGWTFNFGNILTYVIISALVLIFLAVGVGIF